MPEYSPALKVFIAHKIEIDTALSRLQELSDNHFNVPREEVEWRHVVELAYYIEHLNKVLDYVFNEGEFAESGAQND